MKALYIHTVEINPIFYVRIDCNIIIVTNLLGICRNIGCVNIEWNLEENVKGVQIFIED